MFRSATFKLTMWYLAIVMVISVAFSITVYHFATNEVSFGLHHQTQRIFHEYPVFTNDPLLQPQDKDVSASAHHILLRLIYFNILVFIGAGLTSYLLARRTLQPIEAAHEQQKRFTADVSHELRTPLTSLKMGSEVALMDDQATTAMLREALESNLEDSAKMEMLINNLLRLTKLDTDEAQAAFVRLSAQGISEASIKQVQKIADLKHVHLDNQTKDLPLHGDRDALVQLLVILLDNAIKYSPNDSSVVVQTKKQQSNIQISITDQGPGISPEALPHVFDRFYRADKSRGKTTTDGFGLGLSIAKLIADRHHGSVILTSRPGKGTTATVMLPGQSQNN